MVCSYGKLQPGRPDSNKANSHIPKMEIHTRQKLCHFGGYEEALKLKNTRELVPRESFLSTKERYVVSD